MRYARSVKYALLFPVLAATALSGPAAAQSATKPTNDAPNPYNTVSDYFKLPAGRTWGSTSAVEIDKDGKSIWVAERCGTNSCLDRATGKMSADPTILKFDSSGKLVIIWRSYQDGSGDGVFAQRYASTGAPLGPEFRVNTWTSSDQVGAVVASDSSGNFIVVWDSPQDSGGPGIHGIFGQRYGRIVPVELTHFEVE